MKALCIHAGPQALAHIQAQGLQARHQRHSRGCGRPQGVDTRADRPLFV